MSSNVCPRCGKQRIDGKTWNEMAGISKVKVVMTVCPDKKCQEIVDAQYLKDKTERDKQAQIRLDSKSNQKRTSIKL